MRPILAFMLFLASATAYGASATSGTEKAAGSQYLGLEPFVVNLNEEGRPHFMQVKVQVMSPNPLLLEAVKTHTPAVRHALIMLFSQQDPAAMRTADGRESLRKHTLVALQDAVAEFLGGDKTKETVAGIEAVYFTDFVIQ